MTHQDDRQLRRNLRFLKETIQDFVPHNVNAISRHGNASLELGWLAAVAIVCWGWTSANETLTRRVEKACAVVGELFNVDTTVTRQGLMKALASNGGALAQALVDSFSNRLKQMKGKWTSHGKVNVAVDGSKFAAPRTLSNQRRFSAGKSANGKADKCYQSPAEASKAATVQLLTTVFWHIGTELPLLWKIQGSSGSERLCVQELVGKLPENARIIGDAEYVGYPLWSTIMGSKRSFLCRVGSNVTLLKDLGHYKFKDGFVYLWPEQAERRGEPPLVLRLHVIQNGKTKIYLVTNELDMSHEVACQLYKQRWGIEVFFRAVKHSCEKRKATCTSPDNVITELHWTLLGIWAAMYSGKDTHRQRRKNINRISPIRVMRAFYECIDSVCAHIRPICLVTESIATAVIVDESERTTSKSSRNYPRKKKHKSCRPPQITPASPQRKRKAIKFNL